MAPTTTYGWAGFGATASGFSDAGAEYYQNETIRPGQVVVAAGTGAVFTPFGIGASIGKSMLLGSANGVANNLFQNIYYGDTNSLSYGALLGGAFGVLGAKAGGMISNYLDGFKFNPQVSAVLQNTPSVIIKNSSVVWNSAGVITGTTPSAFSQDKNDLFKPLNFLP